MNILNIAYPFSPVSKVSAGGAEHIVRLLDAAVFKSELRSFVIAHQQSEIKGKHYFVPERDGDINSIKDSVYREYRNLISKVLVKENINLIHMHGLDFYEYLPETSIPILVTLHLPPSYYPETVFRMRRNVFFNCVSFNQQNQVSVRTRLVPFIPNGISINEFTFSELKKDYCLCLGRVWYDKGYHLALQAAKTAGSPLIIAGEIYNFESHKIYFNEFIAPHLDGTNYISIPHITAEEKNLLLSEAKCLLVPSLAEETSSLVSMEALASGTPVIAFNTGALPEIVEDSRTGFIVNNQEDMAASIKLVNRISPQVCRAEALRRFASKTMTDKYIQLYYSLVKRKNIVIPSYC
jgi:glycosyltransferase involved in cell wall biosynthesis